LGRRSIRAGDGLHCGGKYLKKNPVLEQKTFLSKNQVLKARR